MSTTLATLHEKCPHTRVEVVDCDLSNMDDVKGVFQRALDRMDGQIHVLVNCAGIQRRAPSVDFPEQDWDDVSLVLSFLPLDLSTTHDVLGPDGGRSFAFCS